MTYWKPPKYANLRGILAEKGIRLYELADGIGKSYVTISNKLQNHTPFTLDEAYRILELLEIPSSKIYEFFPPGGEAASCGEAAS